VPAADAPKSGSLGKIHPSFRLSLFDGIPGDFVVGAQRGNTFLGPSITTPGSQAASREDAGNQLIGTNPCQNSHCFHHILGRLRAVLTAPPVLQSQFSVDTAFPVNDEGKRSLITIQIYDNLVNQRSRDSFLQSSIGVGAIRETVSRFLP
jgi:hypothetical protein